MELVIGQKSTLTKKSINLGFIYVVKGNSNKMPFTDTLRMEYDEHKKPYFISPEASDPHVWCQNNSCRFVYINYAVNITNSIWGILISISILLRSPKYGAESCKFCVTIGGFALFL